MGCDVDRSRGHTGKGANSRAPARELETSDLASSEGPVTMEQAAMRIANGAFPFPAKQTVAVKVEDARHWLGGQSSARLSCAFSPKAERSWGAPPFFMGSAPACQSGLLAAAMTFASSMASSGVG